MIGESIGLPPKGLSDMALQSEFAFAWEAGAGDLVPITGQAATYARAGEAWASDGHPLSEPRPHRHVHSQERFDYLGALYDANGVQVGVSGAALALERSSANLLPASENSASGSGWVKTHSPTIVASARKLGDVSLELVADTSATQVAQIYQVADAPPSVSTRALSVFLARGTSPALSGGRLFVRDATAGVDLASIIYTFAADGTPTLTPLTGVVVGRQRAAGGWRVFLRNDALAATTNTHWVGHEPARVAGEQGNVYIGGWQWEAGLSPSGYIRRTGAGAASRAVETLHWMYDARPPVRTGMQLYVAGVEMGSREESLGLCDVGGNNSVPRLILFSAAGLYQTQLDAGAGSPSGTVASGQPTWGHRFEYLVDLYADGTHRLTSAIDEGNPVVSSLIAAPPGWPPSAWGAARVTLNQYNAATAGLGRFRAFKLGWGTHRRLDQMRTRV